MTTFKEFIAESNVVNVDYTLHNTIKTKNGEKYVLNIFNHKKIDKVILTFLKKTSSMGDNINIETWKGNAILDRFSLEDKPKNKKNFIDSFVKNKSYIR